LVANVQEGEESDGRRVIIGRNGNLWRGYITLCDALGIPITYAIAESRLALPPSGPFSEASMFSLPLLRLTTEKGEQWLSLGSKYAPFGYVPADARGMRAYALDAAGPKLAQVPAGGLLDRMVYAGDVHLAKDGSAEVELEQTLHGKYATALRGALSEMAAQQIRDLVESRILGYAMRGAQLKKYDLVQLDDPDKPLIIRTRSRVPSFAQVAGNLLLIPPPFAPRLSQLAALPNRQTPLLVVDSTEQEVRLKLHLPPGSTVVSQLGPKRLSDGDRAVDIRDRVEGANVLLERDIRLPSGRVQVAAYSKFANFARSADDALSSSIRVKLAAKH
jgi:hypothetical protein